MILYQLRSAITLNFGHISKTLSVLLMAAIFILRRLHQNMRFIETAKVLSPKIASLGALSIFGLCML
jgi:hypothetical protein